MTFSNDKYDDNHDDNGDEVSKDGADDNVDDKAAISISHDKSFLAHKNVRLVHFHQIYPPPYPIFVTGATDDVCVVLQCVA